MELPSYLQIEPVGQCNLRCQMCSIQFRKDGPPFGPLAFMEWDAFTRIIQGFPTLQELHLQGLGEPMMHPRFFDMVQYATSRGIRVTTNSNLTILNRHRAERLVSSGLDTLHVSIDGATAETYERIRLRSRLDRVLRNVNLVNVARRELGARLPRMKMVSVIMRQNLHELPELVRLAKRLEMDSLFVQHLCHDFGEESLPSHYRPMREFVQEQTLFAEDLHRVEHYFDLAREAADELSVDLRLPRTRMKMHPPGTPGWKRCSWPWTSGYVSYQGLAMPCCMVSTPDRINFGNMAEAGVTDVWESEAFQAFRARLDSDNPPDICRSCSIYTGTF